LQIVAAMLGVAVELEPIRATTYSPDAALNGRLREHDAQAGRSRPCPVGTRPLVNSPR
jgi:hypothetical protein